MLLLCRRWRRRAAGELPFPILGSERHEADPTVFAGFVLSNSETGEEPSPSSGSPSRCAATGWSSARTPCERCIWEARSDEGLIRWSDQVQQKTVELVRLRTRDAVATFLDTDYMEKVLARVEEKAGKEIWADAAATIEFVSKKSAFAQAERQGSCPTS